MWAEQYHDPIDAFLDAFGRAEQAEPGDHRAVTLATADSEGHPSARIVLLHGVDTKGFRFYTNYTSRKASQLSANPHAALCSMGRSSGWTKGTRTRTLPDAPDPARLRRGPPDRAPNSPRTTLSKPAIGSGRHASRMRPFPDHHSGAASCSARCASNSGSTATRVFTTDCCSCATAIPGVASDSTPEFGVTRRSHDSVGCLRGGGAVQRPT